MLTAWGNFRAMMGVLMSFVGWGKRIPAAWPARARPKPGPPGVAKWHNKIGIYIVNKRRGSEARLG